MKIAISIENEAATADETGKVILYFMLHSRMTTMTSIELLNRK